MNKAMERVKSYN